MTSISLDVIGYPIGHSKSPFVHETVLRELGITYNYRCVAVKETLLDSYIRSVFEDGINGFNITIPHKKTIIPFLHSLDEDSKLLGAVNTVHVKDGKLLGFNTDGKGFICDLESYGINPVGKRVVILGTGGAAYAVASKLVLEKASSVTVLNRTLSKAQALSDHIFCKLGKKIKIMELTAKNLKDCAQSCDILINATPLGMSGVDDDFEDLSFLECLPKDAFIYDLIYNPEKTSLLKAADSLGIKCANGLGMLIYQGLLADEIFLSRSLPFDILKAKIEKNIKNNKFF